MNDTVLQSRLGTILESYLLNIDNAMSMIESMLAKYVPVEAYTGDVWYIRGKRYPLMSAKEIAKYRNSKLLRNHPWHPYLGIPVLKEMLEYYLYQHTEQPGLYRTGDVVNSMMVYALSEDATDSDILLTYYPQMTDDDLYTILAIFLQMYNNELRPIYTAYPNSVYSICVDTNMYRLFRHDDIRILRYKELLGGTREHSRRRNKNYS